MSEQESSAFSINPHRRVTDWEAFGLLNERNRGTLVIDQIKGGIIFGDHGESFDAHRCPPIEGTWVQIRTAHKQWLYVDGHHRSAGLASREIQTTVRDNYPDFQPVLLDTTRGSFGNPNIVSSGRPYREFSTPFQELPLALALPAGDGPPALTMEEYMIALMPATLAQERIAPKRSAAHLMVYWENLLESKELADKYSTLTALILLNNSAIKQGAKYSLAAVPDYLDQQPKERFFPGMSDDEHERIKRGIRSMVGVLIGVHVTPDKALTAALQLTIEQPEAVGGVVQAKTQIASMLAQREANRTGSPASSFRTEDPATEIRSYYLADDRSRELFFELLKDPRLSLDDVQQIISAPTRGRENRSLLYKRIAKQRNVDRITALIEKQKKGKITETESQLVSSLVDTDPMSGFQLKDLPKEIMEFATSIDIANSFINTLLTAPIFPAKDELIESIRGAVRAAYSKRGTSSVYSIDVAVERAKKEYALAQERAEADAEIEGDQPDVPEILHTLDTTGIREREIAIIYSQLPVALRTHIQNGTLSFRDAVAHFEATASDKEQHDLDTALNIPNVEELSDRERYSGIPVAERPPEVRARLLLLSALGTLRKGEELDPQLGIKPEHRNGVEHVIVILQQALNSLPKDENPS